MAGANTTFTDQVTPVVASWLNDVNNVIYNLLGSGTLAPTTRAQILANLGISSGAPLYGTTAARPVGAAPGTFYLDTTLGIPIWRSAVSTWINSAGVTV
jgi:hypothetical protein